MKRPLLFLLAGLTLAAQTAAPPPEPAARKSGSPTRPPQPHTAAAASYRDLVFPPPKPIPLPAVEALTLPNGIRLYLLEDHEMPVISGAARIRTGSVFDPPDKAGLAELTGIVMRTGGTARHSGEEIDRLLEDRAANLDAVIADQAATVNFSALSENIGPVLESFQEMISAPAFADDKIEQAKAQLHAAVARRNDNPSVVAQREFSALLYGPGKTYGRKMEHATIDAISRADLVAFHARYFFPANLRLALWGDFDTAEMKARIEKLFAGWTVQQPSVPGFPKIAAPPEPATYLAPKRETAQTFFVLGRAGGMVSDPDYAALTIMAGILGQNRLFNQVRTRMANIYSLNAAWEAGFDHPGLLLISGATTSFSTVETIRAVQAEVERMRTSEVTDEELRIARETALNSIVFAYDSRAKAIARLLLYDYYGYPADSIRQYQKALESVTRADVQRVARAQLDPAALSLLVVGNPDGFDQPLDNLGRPVKMVDLRIPSPVASSSPGAGASSARQILARAQQAAGGVEKLAAVQDCSQTAEFVLAAAAGGLHIKEQIRWVSPDYLRQDSDVPTGKISAWYDGTKGWIATPQGSGPLVGPQLRQVQGDLFRLYIRLLLSDRLPGRTLITSGENTVDIASPGGEFAHVVFGSATGLPRTVSYDAPTAAGPPLKVEESFSDFRNVNGIMFPFKMEITQNSAKFADVTVTELKFNTGLKPADLELKPAPGAGK